jgi:hypothetical protein
VMATTTLSVFHARSRNDFRWMKLMCTDIGDDRIDQICINKLWLTSCDTTGPRKKPTKLHNITPYNITPRQKSQGDNCSGDL